MSKQLLFSVDISGDPEITWLFYADGTFDSLEFTSLSKADWRWKWEAKTQKVVIKQTGGGWFEALPPATRIYKDLIAREVIA